MKISFAYCKKNRQIGEFKYQHQGGAKNLNNEIINYLKNIKNGGLCVEIGVFGGGSLLEFHNIVNNKNVKFIGVDVWENSDMMNGNSSLKYDENDWLKYLNIQKDARETLQKIINKNNYNMELKQLKSTNCTYDFFNNKSIDFIHIDGEHSYESVYKECEIYYPKMKNDGMMLFDDYLWPGVPEAINDFCKEKNLKIKVKGQKAYFYCKKIS